MKTLWLFINGEFCFH